MIRLANIEPLFKLLHLNLNSCDEVKVTHLSEDTVQIFIRVVQTAGEDGHTNIVSTISMVVQIKEINDGLLNYMDCLNNSLS